MENTIEQKRARHKRFFQPLEKGEGAYISVTSPVNDTGKLPVDVPPPKDIEEQWLSVDYTVKCAEAGAQNTYFGLDALQSVFINFGPGVQAAFVGAPYKLMPGTIWFDLDPPVKDWNTPHIFKTDKNHELYKVIEAKTKALCAASKGKYAVSVTDIGGQMDVLFSLRGEDILTDLIEYPDEVKDAENQLADDWINYFNTMADMIGPTGCGYTAWIPIVSDKPWYPIQCDLSVMISPAMFEEFVLPPLDKVSTAIGRSIYHLDGPEEIVHLDMLLSLKHVDGIQWVPLPTMKHGTEISKQNFADEMSLDIYRRSLVAGKKVIILNVPTEQIKIVFDTIGSDGIFVSTHFDTRKEADEFIEHAVKMKWVKI